VDADRSVGSGAAREGEPPPRQGTAATPGGVGGTRGRGAAQEGAEGRAGAACACGSVTVERVLALVRSERALGNEGWFERGVLDTVESFLVSAERHLTQGTAL
jgi:hypothetical protein